MNIFGVQDFHIFILLLFWQEQIPFAVVGSREEIVAGGQKIRARKYPWGVVEGKVVPKYIWYVFMLRLLVVENETHCDFVKLREMIIRYICVCT